MTRPCKRVAAARSLRACLLLLALGALASPLAHAQAFFCNTSATPVAFGNYTPMTPTPLTSTGSVSVQCFVLGQTSVTVALSTGASGSYATRALTSGTFTLSYNLYLNAADTQIWGNGSGGSLLDTLTLSPGFPTTSTATVYGAVAPRQNPSPGSYSDAITVTVNY